MPGEKTQAVWDYSEHATITQAQLLEKSSKNAIFLKVMWKTPLFKRLPRPARARESGIVLSCGLGEDELYFVLRGKDLRALADASEVMAEANQALGEYASKQRARLMSA